MISTPLMNPSELLDRQPPSCVELEQKVIGSILLDIGQLDEVLLLINDKSFYDPSFAEIFKTMATIYQNGEPLDLSLLLNELKQKSKIDDIAHVLAKAAQSEITTGYAKHYAQKIQVKHERRLIISAGIETTREGFDESQPIEQVRVKAVNRIEKAVEGRAANEIERVSESVFSLVEAIKAGEPSDQESISTGIEYLDDDLNGGFHPSQSIVLAARPSIGKSALALSFALHAARQSIPAVLFSLEMSCKEVGERTLSNVSRISKSAFESAVKYRGAEVNDATMKIADMPLFVDDQTTTTIEDIVSKIRMLKRKHGIKLAVIDYLQIIEPSNPNQKRQQQIGHISRRIKQAAQDIGIVIVTLSQLNRAGDDNERPLLKHLRESGSIEQDANVVLFLWKKTAGEGEETEPCTLTIGKNRTGKSWSDYDLIFHKAECRFEQDPEMAQPAVDDSEFDFND